MHVRTRRMWVQGAFAVMLAFGWAQKAGVHCGARATSARGTGGTPGAGAEPMSPTVRDERSHEPGARPVRGERADRETLAPLARPPRPVRFEDAKRALERSVYDAEHRREIYCGCRFDERKHVDFEQCESADPYVPVEPESNRAGRIEWDHVLPASFIGHEDPCWSEATLGRQSHREHCRVVSERFALAEGDMHNLLPAVGQLNALRENFVYAEISGEAHVAGCDFEVDDRRVEPRPAARGPLARAMLYAAATYGVPLDRELHRTLVAWDEAYPPDAWERERADRIERLQGNRNPFID